MSPRTSFGKAKAQPLEADIVDAEFETLVPAIEVEPRAPLDYAAPRVSTGDRTPSGGMDMLRLVSSRLPRETERGSPLFWLCGAVMIAGAFWVSGGHSVIRPLFSQANAGPGESIRIASVISRVDRAGVRPVLLVDGKAVNEGREATPMPPLAIHVGTDMGGTTIYNLGTGGGAVEGGGSFAFSSRLNVPKDGVKTVFVTFAK